MESWSCWRCLLADSRDRARRRGGPWRPAHRHTSTRQPDQMGERPPLRRVSAPTRARRAGMSERPTVSGYGFLAATLATAALEAIPRRLSTLRENPLRSAWMATTLGSRWPPWRRTGTACPDREGRSGSGPASGWNGASRARWPRCAPRWDRSRGNRRRFRRIESKAQSRWHATTLGAEAEDELKVSRRPRHSHAGVERGSVRP